MARCMLCSSSVGDADVICPFCGGAVEDGAGDPTWAPADPTGVQAVDLTKVDGAEVDGASDEAPIWLAPPPPGPPPGYGPLPGYGPSAGYGAPPGYGPPAGYGPSAGYGAPPGWYGPAPAPMEGMALASFLTALVGLVLGFALLLPILACPVGAVLGHMALRRIDERGTNGRGLALAGVIIGWVGTAIFVIAVALIVAIVAAAVASS